MSYYNSQYAGSTPYKKSAAVLDRQAVEDLVSLLRALDEKVTKLAETVELISEDVEDIYDELIPEDEEGVDPVNEAGMALSELVRPSEILPDELLNDTDMPDDISVDLNDPNAFKKQS